jgi:4-amino-4-deoxy-L-arabinose transferase-like glycosyltransferase
LGSRRTAALLVAFLAILFVELPGTHLAEPAEARYAEVAREMFESGDLLTPRLNGVAYVEKPPLLYWAEAGSFAVFGVSAWAARLPARLATLGITLLLVLGLRRALGSTAAGLAGLAFLAAPLPFAIGRAAVIDPLLAFFFAATLLAARWAVDRRARGERAWGPCALVGAAAAGAVLSKGIVGLALPGLVLGAWGAAAGRLGAVLSLALKSPAPWVFLALAAPWHVAMEAAHPGFARFYFVREHFERFATDMAGRDKPAWFLPALAVLGFLPWTLAPEGFVDALRGLRDRERRAGSVPLFCGLTVAVVLLFFSVSRSKLPPYLLPACPALAAWTGAWLARPGPALSRLALRLALAATGLGPLGVWLGARSGTLPGHGVVPHAAVAAGAVVAAAWAGWALARRGRSGAALAALAGGLIAAQCAAVLAHPRVASRIGSHDLAEALRRATAPGIRVVLYDKEAVYGLTWELGRPLIVAGGYGELEFAGRRGAPPDLYWTRERFWEAWSSSRLLVIVRESRRERFPAPHGSHVRTVARGRTHSVIANFDVPPDPAVPPPPGS